MILWLASYPRSGNTRLRALLRHRFGVETYSRYNDALDIGKSPALAKAVGHRNYVGDWASFYGKALEADALIPIKTHDWPSDDEKAIYVIRNAPATIVSFCHYLDAHSRYKADIYDVISGAVSYGGWSQHYKAWSPKTRPNTLFLKFEELMGDAEGAVEKIADFTGLSVKANGAAPEFEDLQKQFPDFFRSGSDRKNRAELTDDQMSYLLFLHGETLKELGYIDAYDVDFACVRAAVERESEKLLNFRLGEMAELRRSLNELNDIAGRLSARLEDRDRRLEQLDLRLRARDRKIGELARTVEDQAAEIEQLCQNTNHFHKSKADSESTIKWLRKRRDELEARNAELESALTPRLKSILTLRALRFALAQRRQMKANAPGGAASE